MLKTHMKDSTGAIEDLKLVSNAKMLISLIGHDGTVDRFPQTIVKLSMECPVIRINHLQLLFLLQVFNQNIQDFGDFHDGMEEER